MWLQKILIWLGFAPRRGWNKKAVELQLVISDPITAGVIKDPGFPVDYLWLQPVLGPAHQRVAQLRAENLAWLAPWEVNAPEDYPVTVPTLAQYRREYDWKFVQGESLTYLIHLDSQPVGVITLMNVERGASQSATVGYWLAQPYVGLGIARAALSEVVDFCFLELALHRLDVYVRPENAASLKLVESLPFLPEGVRRNYLYVDGNWRDHQVFTTFKEVWFS